MKYFLQITLALPLLNYISSASATGKYEEKFLTDYIDSGKLNEGREFSKVNWNLQHQQSYSGYFNVNKTFNSNLFFWYFPAESKEQNAPLILWLHGGPGTSSMFGLFVESGPFLVNEELKLKNRKYLWAKNHSIIYIDNPVGSGFSFTDSKEGYSKTQDEISSNLYEALTQFLILFSELQAVPFYIMGESYAGKYVPKLSLKIHDENQRNPRVRINYQGMAIGAGFSDPVSMVDSYGEYFHSLGLISSEARKHFDEVGAQTKLLIEQGNFSGAAQIQDELLGGDSIPYPTYFKNTTGYDFYFNVLETKLPKEHAYYVKFLEQAFVRKALGVGNITFHNQSTIVPEILKDDIFKSVKPTIEQLLNLKYKVLLYVGQFDMIVPHLAVTNFISTLKWNGKFAFEKSDRKVWTFNDDIAGYVQQNENLIYVIIRKSGHNAPYDAPNVCLELITKFTRNLDLISTNSTTDGGKLNQKLK